MHDASAFYILHPPQAGRCTADEGETVAEAKRYLATAARQKVFQAAINTAYGRFDWVIESTLGCANDDDLEVERKKQIYSLRSI